MLRYCEDRELAARLRRNAEEIAREVFDRRKTYAELAAFLEGVGREAETLKSENAEERDEIAECKSCDCGHQKN